MISATFVSFLALGLFSGVHADQALSLTVSGPAKIEDVDNFAVVAKLTNIGSDPVKLYKDPRSALDDFPEDTFTVTGDDGSAVEFIGAHVKWSYKASDDFVTLAPGESHEVTHNLGEAYNFTKQGTYAITPETTFYAVPDGRNPYPVPIVASTPEAKYSTSLSGSLVSTVVAKRISDAAEVLAARSLDKRATFNGCSASQRTAITTASANALTYTARAISYLSGGTMGPRYRKWFGTYTAARRNLVLRHYQLIQSGNPNSFRYDCTCTRSGVYAYVYSATFGTVYLCPVFWQAPALGTDSKAGTIVHESSHFTRNGGTSDYAYGQSAASALATSDPARAVMNADSHEYFAENTPSLS